MIHFNSLPVLLILKGQGCSFLTQSSNSTSSSVSEQEKQKKSLKNERSQHAIITEIYMYFCVSSLPLIVEVGNPIISLRL